MPFVKPDDTIRVLRHLKISSSLQETVENKMGVLEEKGETWVAIARSILDDLDSGKTKISQTREGGDLIQADVLRWSEGGKASGLLSVQQESRLELVALLDLQEVLKPPNQNPNSYEIQIVL